MSEEGKAPWLRGPGRGPPGLNGWLETKPAPPFSAGRIAAPTAEAAEPPRDFGPEDDSTRMFLHPVEHRPPEWHGENGDAILASIRKGLSLDVICALHEVPPWAVRAVAAAHRVAIGPRPALELARLTAERDRLLEEIAEARRWT